MRKAILHLNFQHNILIVGGWKSILVVLLIRQKITSLNCRKTEKIMRCEFVATKRHLGTPTRGRRYILTHVINSRWILNVNFMLKMKVSVNSFSHKHHTTRSAVNHSLDRATWRREHREGDQRWRHKGVCNVNSHNPSSLKYSSRNHEQRSLC